MEKAELFISCRHQTDVIDRRASKKRKDLIAISTGNQLLLKGKVAGLRPFPLLFFFFFFFVFNGNDLVCSGFLCVQRCIKC